MNLLEKLNRIDHLAKASKFSRLLANPIKYLDAIYINKFKYPNSKLGIPRKCATFFDTEMKVILPAGTDLFLLGAKTHDSEIRLAKFMVNNLEAGDEVLDIGAHYGYFSLLAANLVGVEGKVTAIEASRDTYLTLTENTKEEKNTTVLNIACAETDEEMTFYQFPVLYSEYNSLDFEQYKDEAWLKNNKVEQITIQALKVDSLIAKEELNPKLIKIDVEGAEEKVVRGMIETLDKKQMAFVSMEYLENSRKNVHSAAAKIIERRGYQANYIDTIGNLIPINLVEIKTYFKKKHLDSDNIIFTPIVNSK